MNLQNIGVIGAGTMGNGIAQVCAVAGFNVTLIDISESALQKALAQAEARGWLTRDLQWAQPTERGFDFLNDLQSLFLPD